MSHKPISPASLFNGVKKVGVDLRTYLEYGADRSGDGGEDVLEQRDLLLAAGVLRRLGHSVEEVGVIRGKVGLIGEEIRAEIQRRQLPAVGAFIMAVEQLGVKSIEQLWLGTSDS